MLLVSYTHIMLTPSIHSATATGSGWMVMRWHTNQGATTTESEKKNYHYANFVVSLHVFHTIDSHLVRVQKQYFCNVIAAERATETVFLSFTLSAGNGVSMLCMLWMLDVVCLCDVRMYSIPSDGHHLIEWHTKQTFVSLIKQNEPNRIEK